MEDVMETCYLDCISMCPHQYRCRECKREKQHQDLISRMELKIFSKKSFSTQNLAIPLHITE